TATTGEWHVALRSRDLFTKGHRYTLSLSCRVLSLGDKDCFYFMTRPVSTNMWTTLRTEDEIGVVRKKEHWFVNDTYDDMSLQLGIRKQGRAIIDSIVITELPLLTAAQLQSAGAKVRPTAPYEPFGICLHADRIDTHPFGYTDELLDKALSLWKDMGVQWVRIGLGKPFTNREAAVHAEAVASQLARNEKLMNGLRERGIQFYIIASAGQVPWYTPPKASIKDGFPAWAYPHPDSEEYRLLIEAYARMYAKASDYWEIGNEMDWEFWAGTPEHFVRNLAIARETLRKYNPKVKIIMGGLAQDGIIGEKKGKDDYLQRMYDAGLKEKTDILAFHLYQSTVERNIYQLNRSIAVMAKNGDAKKPIWITETAKSIWNSTEDAQADYLRDTYTLLLRHPNIEKVFWWNFKSLKTKLDRESGLALVETNLAPRKAYEVFKSMPKNTDRFINNDLLRIDGLDR
ncbi:MAG: glycosyl hydrolase, partial [Spirochaetota bacterium]